MSPIMKRKLLPVYVIFFLVGWNNFCSTLPHPSKKTTQMNRKSPTTIANEMCTDYKELKFEIKILPPAIPGGSNITSKTLKCQRLVALVVNGKPALPMEFPHMALIGYGKSINTVEWKCGGSLISKQFVLSAAHCSRSRKPTWVRLGELDVSTTKDETKSEDYKIIQEFKHPLYQNGTNYHDIILYKLSKEVKFSPYIRPLCLQTSTTPPKLQSKVIVSGWGQTASDEIRSDKLLKAAIFIADSKKCQNFYGGTSAFKNGFNSSIAVCALDEEKGQDTCGGDSGGPLQIQSEACIFTQIGITSTGSINCGDKQTPGVYTNVAAHIDWIQPIVWPQTGN